MARRRRRSSARPPTDRSPRFTAKATAAVGVAADAAHGFESGWRNAQGAPQKTKATETRFGEP